MRGYFFLGKKRMCGYCDESLIKVKIILTSVFNTLIRKRNIEILC